jgi:hypothetical protein
VIYTIGDERPFERVWVMATCSEQGPLLRPTKKEVVHDVRMPENVYQVAAAIRLPKTSWTKEMRRAPRRKGKQHKK